MTISDFHTSSQRCEHKTFCQITRDRLLYEMLRSTKNGDSKATWKVLVLDRMTYKIMSYSCKLSEAAHAEAPLMEIIHKNREPFPWDAIYFIQPTKENVGIFLSDMSGRSPLYKKTFVFFSSPAPRELVNQKKEDTTVLSRIGALSEMNLEYFAIDNQGFVTDNERALKDLFGDEESSCKGDECLNAMATRIATIFASLRVWVSFSAVSCCQITWSYHSDNIP